MVYIVPENTLIELRKMPTDVIRNILGRSKHFPLLASRAELIHHLKTEDMHDKRYVGQKFSPLTTFVTVTIVLS